MHARSPVPFEAEKQAIHDNYLLDHLMYAFHSGKAQPPSEPPDKTQCPSEPRVTIAASVYAHIRDAWSGPQRG